jgi:hypothetical protein
MKIFPVMNGGVGGIDDDTITASDARAMRLFRIAARIAAGSKILIVRCVSAGERLVTKDGK